MKRITFTKACKVDPKYPKRLARPNYPGYLFTHSNHPGREVVIARGSKTMNFDGSIWKFSSMWALYDRKSGLNFDPAGNRKTIEARVESATEYLAVVSPENMQAMLDERVAKRLGAIMSL